MNNDINMHFLNPKETTLLAFEQFDGKPSMVPRKIKGGELRFPALDDKKKTIDLKLLEALRDFKGEEEDLWKYLIDIYNAALQREITDIFNLLKIPQVLKEIVLEYATMGSYINSWGKPEEIGRWFQMMGVDNSWYFPWQNDNSLTQILVEEEFYRPLKQKLIPALSAFLPHLPDILNFLPASIVNLMSDYIDIAERSPKRSEVVMAITDFMEGYKSSLRSLDIESSFTYQLLDEAYFAISSIRNLSDFKPMKESKLLGNRFPIKNTLDFLAVMVTQPVFLSNPEAPMTLFEHILHNLDLMKMPQINGIPEFFNRVKALYESSYIIAMNKDAFTPPNSPAKIVILPFEQIGHHFPVTALQDEKGELRFPVLPEGNSQRNWSLQLMEGLRDISEESKLKSLFKKIRPNSDADILIQALPMAAMSRFDLGRDYVYTLHFPWINDDKPQQLAVWAAMRRYLGRDYGYPVHFPWVNDEKHQQLTHLLIEEEIYESQTRKEVISKILPYVLFSFPTVIVNIIDDYVEEKQSGKEWVINQVEAFIQELTTCIALAAGFVIEREMLQIARKALQAIRYEEGFELFDPEMSSNRIKSHFQFPMKNAFDFLTAMVTQQMPGGTPGTLFEVVINLLCRMNAPVLRQVPEFFNMIKSLVESAYILSGNVPSHVGFHLTPAMENSLYIHVDRRLKLGHKIKALNNRGETPVLLMTILKLLKENIMEKNVKSNDMNGFIFFLLDVGTGVRLLNYHKRFKALDIVYNYINEPKTLGSLLAWFKNKDRSKEAKALATTIVNTSHLEVSLINEIEQSPLFKSNEPYATVLHQVRDTLINDLRGIQSTASFQQEPTVQPNFKF